MSNLPKIVTIVALGFVGAVSAGYYALTGQKGSDGKIVIATVASLTTRSSAPPIRRRSSHSACRW